MQIPVQNIYYLFVYAWNRLNDSSKLNVKGEKNEKLENLLAQVLRQATDLLLRRGLDRGYTTATERTSCIKGRLEITDSIKTLSFPRGHAVCSFDELTYDVLHNRILKSTLWNLAHTKSIDKKLHADLVGLYSRLDGIAKIRITNQLFGKIQLHSNNSFYAFVLNLCQLVHNRLLPSDRAGQFAFDDVLLNEQKMGTVFEDFVRNFYKLEQARYKVTSDRFPWHASGDLNVVALPELRTDIVLRDAHNTIIIDTKYYLEILKQSSEGSVYTVNSDHLRQIYCYLKNLEYKAGPDANAEGYLLYPSSGKALNLNYQIDGHRIRVVTINLNQDWTQIHQDLLNLIEVNPHQSVAA